MNHKIEENYDVVICGSGPAGLIAGLHLASTNKNLKVALLDKRDPWREPVACAEAVHKGGLYSLLDVDESWIRTEVDGVVFVSPDGTKVKYTQKNSGLIIDRAKMHRSLAERCAEAGVDVHFRSLVKSISEFTNGKRNLSVKQGEEMLNIQAKFVIDSSGAGSRLVTDSGVVDGKFDIEPAVFGLMEGWDYDPRYIELYFGQNFAPGGYGWVFPRDETVANVGICVGRPYVKTHAPRRMFDIFCDKFNPGAPKPNLHGGPIACGQTREPHGANQLFKAGDCTNGVNPISRAGILEAMNGGRNAAEAILQLLENPAKAEEAQIYADVLNKWMNYKGNSHEKLAKAKWPFAEIPDKTFNKAALKLSKLPEDKLTLPRILWATLTSSPSILWKMRTIL